MADSRLPAPRPSRISARRRAACCPAAPRRGSWPRLAFGILAIIVRDGPTDAGGAAGASAASQSAAPNPDRLRDYQDRLRVLDERSRQQAQVDAIPPAAPVFYEDTGTDPGGSARGGEATPRVREPVCQQRRAQPSDATGSSRSRPATDGRPLGPSEDVRRRRRLRRASTRSQTQSCAPPRAPRQRWRLPQEAEPSAAQDDQSRGDNRRARPGPTEPIQSRSGPTHRLLEGTVHRRRAHESSRRHVGRTRQLPRHQPGLLAQRPAHRDSGRCACARRRPRRCSPSERRDSPSRFTVSCSRMAARIHSTSSWGSTRSVTRACAIA